MRQPRAIYALSHARARRLHRIVRVSHVGLFVDGLYAVSARSRTASRHHEPEQRAIQRLAGESNDAAQSDTDDNRRYA